MKQITLNTLYQDRKQFEAMLQQEHDKLANAQAAILRIEGVLVYINRNITFMEKPPKKEVVEDVPPIVHEGNVGEEKNG